MTPHAQKTSLGFLFLATKKKGGAVIQNRDNYIPFFPEDTPIQTVFLIWTVIITKYLRKIDLCKKPAAHGTAKHIRIGADAKGQRKRHRRRKCYDLRMAKNAECQRVMRCGWVGGDWTVLWCARAMMRQRSRATVVVKKKLLNTSLGGGRLSLSFDSCVITSWGGAASSNNWHIVILFHANNTAEQTTQGYGHISATFLHFVGGCGCVVLWWCQSK